MPLILQVSLAERGREAKQRSPRGGGEPRGEGCGQPRALSFLRVNKSCRLRQGVNGTALSGRWWPLGDSVPQIPVPLGLPSLWFQSGASVFVSNDDGEASRLPGCTQLPASLPSYPDTSRAQKKKPALVLGLLAGNVWLTQTCLGAGRWEPTTLPSHPQTVLQNFLPSVPSHPGATSPC